MDIWDWVHDAQYELYQAGHIHLAEMISQLPNDIVNGRHQEVDLYIDALIADAKTSGFTWIELYMRHWRMQSKVAHRSEPKGMIKEAVSLLEFAHSKENQDCPQSICVVQDLGLCYGEFDGPGYAEERLAVMEETLAKITPQWACYECIGTEHAKALLDAERYQECEQFLDQVDKDYLENGKAKSPFDLLLTRVEAVMRQGDYTRARKLGQSVRENDANPGFLLTRETKFALIEALDGDYEKALEHLPSLEEIKEKHSADLIAWFEVMVLVLKNVEERRNEATLLQMQDVADLMLERGTYRQAFNAYGWLIECGLLFPTNLDLTALLAQMDVAHANLHRDLGARERRDDLAQRCQAV